MRQADPNYHERLQAWLAGARARLLIQAECRQLRRVLPHLVGYRMLQVGRWGFAPELMEDGGMLCRWVAAAPGEAGGHLQFDGTLLPIASRRLDAVILAHTLELSASPHRLLREVARVLCDRGQLLVVGFNPYSPWSLAQRLKLSRTPYPGRRGPIALGRVCDWLDLLDFEVAHACRFGAGFPYLPAAGVDLDRPGWWRLPALLGQAYMVVARRRIARITPLGAQRKERAMAISGGMPEPSARLRYRRSKAA